MEPQYIWWGAQYNPKKKLFLANFSFSTILFADWGIVPQGYPLPSPLKNDWRNSGGTLRQKEKMTGETPEVRSDKSKPRERKIERKEREKREKQGRREKKKDKR